MIISIYVDDKHLPGSQYNTVDENPKFMKGDKRGVWTAQIPGFRVDE